MDPAVNPLAAPAHRSRVGARFRTTHRRAANSGAESSAIRKGQTPAEDPRTSRTRFCGEAAARVTTARTHIAITVTAIPQGAQPGLDPGRANLTAAMNPRTLRAAQ